MYVYIGNCTALSWEWLRCCSETNLSVLFLLDAVQVRLEPVVLNLQLLDLVQNGEWQCFAWSTYNRTASVCVYFSSHTDDDGNMQNNLIVQRHHLFVHLLLGPLHVLCFLFLQRQNSPWHHRLQLLILHILIDTFSTHRCIFSVCVLTSSVILSCSFSTSELRPLLKSLKLSNIPAPYIWWEILFIYTTISKLWTWSFLIQVSHVY